MMPRATPPAKAEKCLVLQDNERVCKNAHYNGRDAVQQVRHKADHGRKCGASILGEVDTRQKTDRNSNQSGKQEHFPAADDCIGHSATDFSNRCGQLREEVPVQEPAALNQKITKNEKQHSNRQQRAHSGYGQHDALTVLLYNESRVSHLLPFVVVMSISNLAAPLITIVRANSTRPSSTSALK